MKRFFAHIGFSVAITLIALCLASTKLVIISTIGLAILFIASLCLRYFRSNITVPLCLGSALFACVLFISFNSVVATPQLELSGTKQDLSFYIIDLEDTNDSGEYVYTAKLTNGGKIRVKSDSKINADYYTVINANAKLHSIGDKPFSSFGYWGDGIYLSAKIDDYTVTNSVVHSPMVHILHLRQSIISAFNDIIGDDEAGIAIALVTGNKRYISSLVYNYFKFSGSTHIMAVSGLHLTVVAGSTLLILRKLRVSDYVVSPTIIAVILFYSALAGFSKSVVRAGIMMTIMVIAPLFKTHGDSLNSLGLAVFIICINPFAVTDIGMILSVLSTLAMIVASQRLNTQSINFETSIKDRARIKLVERIKAVYFTLFILAFTLPVLYITYGYVSIASVLASLIVVPFGSMAMVLSLLTFVFYRTVFATAFAYITKGIIHIIIVFLRFVSSFSGSIIPLGNYFSLVIIGVLIIIGVCFIYKNGVLLRKGIAISLVFAIVSSILIIGYTRDYSYIYVTKNGATVIEHNGSVVVGGVDDLSDYYDVYSYLMSRNEDIDLLIEDSNVENTVKLSQSVHTNIMLTDDLDQYLLDVGCFDDIEVKNSYTVDFDNGLVVDYYLGDYTVNVDGVTAFCGKKSANADILINRSDDIIIDKNGNIDLSTGDILYTIKDNGFSARRINIWQE